MACCDSVVPGNVTKRSAPTLSLWRGDHGDVVWQRYGSGRMVTSQWHYENLTTAMSPWQPFGDVAMTLGGCLAMSPYGHLATSQRCREKVATAIPRQHHQLPTPHFLRSRSIPAPNNPGWPRKKFKYIKVVYFFMLNPTVHPLYSIY